MENVAFCVGLAVFLAMMIGLIMIRSKKSPVSLLSENANEDFIEKILKNRERALARKPWSMSFGTYKAIAVLCSISLALAAFLLTGAFLYAILAALVGLLAPEVMIAAKSTTSKAEFEERYAVSLKQLVAALKSGLSIHQAVENVCISPFIHDSVRIEYKRLDADLKLGISIKEAFLRFADRTDCADAKDVAIAINIQSKIGGREAATIETAAQNISDRIMLRKEIKSLFAGSSATVISMDIAPFAIILFIYFIVPGYLKPFFDSAEMFVVFIGLILFIGAGSIVIHKIIYRMKKECGIQ